jgi:hypothetical protein
MRFLNPKGVYLVNLLTMNKNILSGLAIAALTLSSATAYAGNANGHNKTLYNPNTPSLTVVNTISDVHGSVAGFLNSAGELNDDMYNPDNVSIVYPISGDVYATVTDDDTGVTLGAYEQRGSISATVLFSTSFFGLLMHPWQDLEATLPWTMSDDLTGMTNPLTGSPFSEFSMIVDGTTFTFEEELTGRAFPHLGPVEDPTETDTMALRMSGCAGLRADGEGAYADKVGTLCLNGTFSFDGDFNGHGVSNCSIAIHDPQPDFPAIVE